MEKDKIDKIINMVAVVTFIVSFIGAIVAIWVGVVGIKILLTAVVLFIADYIMFNWLRQLAKEKSKGKSGGVKENESHMRELQ